MKQSVDIDKEFSEILMDTFKEFCIANEKDISYENLLDYLVQHQLIEAKIIDRYVVIKAYDKLYSRGELKKGEIISQIAAELGMTKSKVDNIVKNHYLDFTESCNS